MIRNRTCDRHALKIAVGTNAQVLLIVSVGAVSAVDDGSVCGRRGGGWF